MKFTTSQPDVSSLGRGAAAVMHFLRCHCLRNDFDNGGSTYLDLFPYWRSYVYSNACAFCGSDDQYFHSQDLSQKEDVKCEALTKLGCLRLLASRTSEYFHMPLLLP
jgi:hypothetical protein